MTPADAEAFAEIMVRLDTVYSKPASPLRGAAYKEALADVPMDLLRTAVSRPSQASRLYPRPSDLRQLADEVQAARERKALLPPPATEHEGEPVYHCPHCLDTGYVNWDGSDIHTLCPPMEKYGRAQGWTVIACACVTQNPAGHKQRDARRDYLPHRPWGSAPEGQLAGVSQ